MTTHILEGHSDEVWNVCFSPNGKFLASGSKDSTTIIWDTDVIFNSLLLYIFFHTNDFNKYTY